MLEDDVAFDQIIELSLVNVRPTDIRRHTSMYFIKVGCYQVNKKFNA